MSAFERDFVFKRFGQEVAVKGYAVDYPPSRTDPTYYRPNSQLIADFIRAGENIRAAQASMYDFPDGKDDGSEVPLRGNYEPAEVSTMANEHAMELERKRVSKKERDQSLKEFREAIAPDKAPEVSEGAGNAPSDAKNEGLSPS